MPVETFNPEATRLEVPPDGVEVIGHIEPAVLSSEYPKRRPDSDHFLELPPVYTRRIDPGEVIPKNPPSAAFVVSLAASLYPESRLSAFVLKELFDQDKGVEFESSWLGVHYDGHPFLVVSDINPTVFYPAMPDSPATADTGKYWPAPAGAVVKVGARAHHSSPPVLGTGERTRLKVIVW